MANDRISQIVTEVLSIGDPKARNSQEVVEVLSIGDPKARFSQHVVEVLINATVIGRVSQHAVEVLIQTNYILTEPASNTIAFTHSATFNIVDDVSASNTIVFDHSVEYDLIDGSGSTFERDAENTISFSHDVVRLFVDDEQTSNTISFSHSCEFHLPLAVHPRNTITFGQSVACVRIRNRDTSNTLTVTHLVHRILELSADNTIAFGQLEDEDYIKPTFNDLVFDHENDVEKFIVRTSFSNPIFTNTALVNTVLERLVEQTITFTHTLIRVIDLEADNTILFTQSVVGVASKYIAHTIIFTQLASCAKVLNREVNSVLGLFDDNFLNKSINKRMRTTFNIGHQGRLLHILGRSADNTLTFTQDLVKSRFNESVSNSFSNIFHSIQHTHIKNKVASNTLTFGHSVQVNTILGLSGSSTLTFLNSQRRQIRIGDLNEIEIPNVIVTVIKQGYIYDCNGYTPLKDRKKNLMTLSVAERAIVLPAPLFGDRLGNTDTFNMSFSMNGEIYTTVKKSETQTFGFEWDISVRKGQELAEFVFDFNTRAIRILTWTGEIWIARLMSNPINMTDMLRTDDCDSKVLVALDFEGLRIH